MKKKDNVIPFPKEQTTRARLRERASHQKAVMALSILSILMVSVLSNQWLTKPQQESAGRGIASFSSLSPQSDLKWEHRMARELSEAKGLEAHLAERPSLREELVFGALGGRYALRTRDEKIVSIEYIQNGRWTGPIAVKDRAALLSQYRDVFAVSFNEVGRVSQSDNAEVWSLIAADKTIVGSAKVQMDAEGRLVSLTFE